MIGPGHLPSRIVVCEVLMRDGIQAWPHFIATADKQRMVRAIADAGFAELDATAFVSPRLVPQLVDGCEVLAAVPPTIRVRVLAVNGQGVERAIEAHRTIRPVNRCGMPFSVSEPHNRANLRRGHEEQKQVVRAMIADLLDAGIEPLLGVVTAFGCPITGRIAPQAALDIAQWGYALGVRTLMFGDTTGMGDPAAVSRLFSGARDLFPDAELIAHFHDNRGVGIANTLAAIAAGATTVDACLGGLGGEPAAIELGLAGSQGNVVTEDLVVMLDAMGIQTGINLSALLHAGHVAEELVTHTLFSKVQRAGLAFPN